MGLERFNEVLLLNACFVTEFMDLRCSNGVDVVSNSTAAHTEVLEGIKYTLHSFLHALEVVGIACIHGH